MDKPKPMQKRLAFFSALALSLGFEEGKFSPSFLLRQQRGKAPKGMKFRSSSIYTPGGPNRNVEPTLIKNPKVAANVQMMHERWHAAFLIRTRDMMSGGDKA